MSLSTLIDFQNLNKSYQLGNQTLPVLKNINLQVNKGELLAIMGASGSGKSTLLNILGLLDRPTEGSYKLEEKEVSHSSEDELAHLRNQYFGFVFQSFFLLPRLSALQNVGLPLFYRGIDSHSNREQSLEILKKVSMEKYAKHKPNELSGGQQQRVAIARALVGNPKIILADEPTGALDSTIGQEVMDLFIRLNKEEGTTTIIVTHDDKIANQCKRVIRIKDGIIEEASS